jgi:hypothetical protein
VQRNKLQVMLFKGPGHRADFLLHGVFKVAAGAENFQALESGGGNLAEHFRCQLPRYK